MKFSYRAVNIGIFSFASAMMLIAYLYIQTYLSLLPWPRWFLLKIFLILPSLFAFVVALNLLRLSNRAVNLGILGFASVMMLIAYFYFQTRLGLLPCPLCVSQRIFVILAGLIALAAALHNPSGISRKIYNALTVLTALVGATVSGRQVWLQSLPEDQVPACGPTFGYLYEYFPLQDLLSAMFFGEGSCAEIHWQFLGLSIPGWTLLAFEAIIIICLWQFFRKESQP